MIYKIKLKIMDNLTREDVIEIFRKLLQYENLDKTFYDISKIIINNPIVEKSPSFKKFLMRLVCRCFDKKIGADDMYARFYENEPLTLLPTKKHKCKSKDLMHAFFKYGAWDYHRVCTCSIKRKLDGYLSVYYYFI